MHAIFILIHLMVSIALVGAVLLQKSEGGGLGLGGGGMSGFMTGRSTANLLTRTTGILFACFLGTSIVLAVLAARQHNVSSSIFDRMSTGLPISTPQSSLPVPVPNGGKPAAPAPKTPSVPLAQ